MTVNTPRLIAALATLGLGMSLVGCDLISADDDGPEDGEVSEPAGQQPGENAKDGEDATLPPEFLECGDPSATDEEPGLMLAPLNLTEASWATPPGFTETFAYYEDNPVENLVSMWVAEPESDPVDLDVVSVVTYDGLDWGDLADRCGRVPVAAVEERLAGYRDHIGAEGLSEPEMTTLDGHPAIEQSLRLEQYDYQGYWLFSEDQLLHLYCQWTGEQDVIEDACAELVGSLEVD